MPFQFDNSGRIMTADVFIPSLNLAVEYNGEMHYEEAFFGSTAERRKYDDLKVSKFAEKGITLVQVPHWWDGKIRSLIEVIHKHRPDIEFIKR